MVKNLKKIELLFVIVAFVLFLSWLIDISLSLLFSHTLRWEQQPISMIKNLKKR